ncbi:unnamed protein product [Prunus armeniaca]|uniref:Uncharacterized protein n=1 Tax=Prunus armeniaca TaxID=36596 RepID=A0A6J5VYH7_PRUAR|nr:unnamed protein product [Prunus armeniaca]
MARSIPSQFRVEQFDGNMSFTIWQRIVKAKDAKQERMVVISEKTWSRGSDDGKKENSAREGVESRFVFRANQ